MAKKDLGKLVVCHDCGAKFFDLNRQLTSCLKCSLPLNESAPKRPAPKKKAAVKKGGDIDDLENIDDLDGSFDGEFDVELDGDFSTGQTIESDDDDIVDEID